MEETLHNGRLVRFGVFEVDLRSGELRKAGAKLKLSGQPFQVLAILLENPGEIVTREDLLKRLWPDTFVDVDHNLNTAINKIREVLGDSAENPRFVETSRGADIVSSRQWRTRGLPCRRTRKHTSSASHSLGFCGTGVLIGAFVLIAAAGLFLYKRTSGFNVQRSLTRLTFDEGLQRSYLVTGRPLHRLQFRPRRKVRHLGPTSQRGRSRPDHQGAGPTTGNLTGHLMASTSPIVRKARRDIHQPAWVDGNGTKDRFLRLLSPLVAGQFPDSFQSASGLWEEPLLLWA